MNIERLAGPVTGLLTGIGVGLVAAFVHRFRLDAIDLGLILGLMAAAAAGLFTRAMGGRAASAWLAVGLLAAVLAVRFLTPGGDRIVLDDARGTLLTVGLPAIALVMTVLPDSWFRAKM